MHQIVLFGFHVFDIARVEGMHGPFDWSDLLEVNTCGEERIHHYAKQGVG